MLKVKRERVSDPLLMGMNVPLVYCRLNVALLEESCDWMQILPVSVERASVSLVCKPELSKSLSVDEEEQAFDIEEQALDIQVPQFDDVLLFGLTYLVVEYEKRDARVTLLADEEFEEGVMAWESIESSPVMKEGKND